MPIYRYECPECKNKIKLFRSSFKKDDNTTCNSCMFTGKFTRLLSDNVSGRAMETKDAYRNKSVVQDTEKMVSDRAKDQWKKYELPEFIEKNGMEEAIRNGWIDPETKKPK